MEPRWPERRLQSDGTVVKGTPTISGLISNENVLRVTANWPGAFRNCHRNRIATDPTARGHFRIRATIGPTGEVVSTELLDRSGVPNDVAWCMVQRCCRSYFYAPETERATVEIPVTLEPIQD